MWIAVDRWPATIFWAMRQGVVDRDRVAAVHRRLEGERAAGGGVHADHASVCVDHRPAGVAGLELRVRLDQPAEPLRGVGIVAGGDRPAEPDDRARCAARRAADPAGVAVRRDGVVDLQAARVAERCGRQSRCVLELDHGHVLAERIAEHLRPVRAVRVDDGRADRRRAADDVVVREDDAGAREDDPGAGGLGALVAEVRVDVHDPLRRRLPCGTPGRGEDESRRRGGRESEPNLHTEQFSTAA